MLQVKAFCYSNWKGIKECFKYNASTDDWDEMASMKTKRTNYGLIQINEKSFWITGKEHIMWVYLWQCLNLWQNFRLS